MVNLRNLLTLSHVPRWAIIDTSKPQTVGDHSFRVAAICLFIVRELHSINVEVNREEVMVKAITHDIEEAKTGDMPTPYKKLLKSIGLDDNSDTDTIEDYVVKIADIAEAFIFIKRYGIKTRRIQEELKTLLIKLRHQAWEIMTAPDVVSQSWWNRIIDRILEIGVDYE
jgi:hypothetical protein